MDIREITQRAVDAWNNRDQEAFLAGYDAECEVTSPNFTGKGHQGVRDFWALWNGAFPDNRVTRTKVVAEGSTCAEQSTFQGTNSGALQTPDGSQIPPTGRQVAVSFTLFSTTNGDKITAAAFHFDQVDMLTQLGLMPG